MKKTLAICGLFLLTIALLIGASACSSDKNGDNNVPSSGQPKTEGESKKNIDGLPQGFPETIPFYEGAQVIDSDNFNGNNYTVIYSVDADYDKVLSFYVKAFKLNDSDSDEGEAYFEGFDFGTIFIKGLTIQDTGSNVNVFMTLEDTSASSLEEDEDDDDQTGSDIMTYENAVEVSLDREYPVESIPIPKNAKVIGCSMIPNKGSGFVDLILPASDFDNAVSFYTQTLSLTPKKSSTAVQEAAQFNGIIDDCKVAIAISHLLSSGNDTLIQITIDKQ